jgi:hypothetical protein
MTEAQATFEKHRPDESPRGTKRVLHRVCIQCNNMFRVTPENFEAKQCPNCHKG